MEDISAEDFLKQPMNYMTNDNIIPPTEHMLYPHERVEYEHHIDDSSTNNQDSITWGEYLKKMESNIPLAMYNDYRLELSWCQKLLLSLKLRWHITRNIIFTGLKFYKYINIFLKTKII